MDFYVQFWGTRGSIPTPGMRTRRYGGNTSCVEIRFGQELFICDAGSGIRDLGVNLLERTDAPITAHFLFSHAHWDHIQGFPFFEPAYFSQNLFYIYGSTVGDDRFYRLLSGQMRSDYFPVAFSALKAEIAAAYLDNGGRTIGQVQIGTVPLNHPGGCIGYSFFAGGKRIVYLTDNEIPLPDGLASPNPATGRRAVPAALVEFVRDADLLIADGQFTDAEHLARPGWGHSSCLTAVDLALHGGVKQLALFHHDPGHSDADVDFMLHDCSERVAKLDGNVKVFAARERMELKI
ncbi:MAG: MBL fold metallo-hydrolase [Opitutaceae bacterium]|nr:MBL fold metallo-hydrolase [Verrucomicrobiales bacterium]